MATDGNCLFRAVAHQVYGDADKHDALRNACCDYMLSDGQKEHLENFVDGDFNKYVEYELKIYFANSCNSFFFLKLRLS